MSTKSLEKLVNNLSHEVSVLRSYVIGAAGKDAEGNYKPSFVKAIKKASAEKPTHTFSGKGSLLKLLKKNK